MIDSDFQALSTIGSSQSPKPPTIASAATVAPVSFLSFISGTVAIANITPPIVGGHMFLVFVFTTTTPVAFTTTGNIKYVATPTQNIPMLLFFDPLEGKWYPGEVTT